MRDLRFAADDQDPTVPALPEEIVERPVFTDVDEEEDDDDTDDDDDDDEEDEEEEAEAE